MAESQISTKNGAVALPSGHNADFQAFEITEEQPMENTSRFGEDTHGRMLGNGRGILSVDVAAFAKKGAASTSPGIGSLSGGGGAATFTIDTGTTVAATFIVSRIRLGVSVLRAGAPLSFSLFNGGDPTVTWPTS